MSIKEVQLRLFFTPKIWKPWKKREASWEKLQKSEEKEVVQERVNIQEISIYTDQY